MNECCAVVDLRQYTLHPGKRDDLIDVFDTHLVDGQERTGMHIVGQFRDLDDPDRFVWIRGFRDLPARADALNAFYFGPDWRAHAAAANVTMIDSDNALLLRPVRLGAGYPALDAPRTGEAAGSVIAGAVYHRAGEDDEFVEFFTDHVAPVLTATGAEPVAVFESLVAENNFPQLPPVLVVRRVVGEPCEPGEHHLVPQRQLREVVLGNQALEHRDRLGAGPLPGGDVATV